MIRALRERRTPYFSSRHTIPILGRRGRLTCWRVSFEDAPPPLLRPMLLNCRQERLGVFPGFLFADAVDFEEFFGGGGAALGHVVEGGVGEDDGQGPTIRAIPA